MEKGIFKKFAKYVSLNIIGMIGLSLYILADTFFVSKALGMSGIAALNFAISIYSIIHGVGLMIGIGGSTRYSILKSQKENNKANAVYSTSIKLGVVFGLIFILIGIFGSRSLSSLLGADASTLDLTQTYLTTILCFSPFFITNNILLAFVRNDNNPKLPMIAMLTGSFFNVILDYIFMFPLGMGMFGAAFATSLAPIISLAVLSLHFIRKDNNFSFINNKMKLSKVRDISNLGLAAFINEVSSAVVLITFNLIILKLRGNVGVAAYAVVANISLIGVAIFTGIAQGIQPLVSEGYGRGSETVLKKIKKYSVLTTIIIASLIYVGIYFNSDGIVSVFNSQQNMEMASIARTGLRIYFLGFFFAGLNIVMATYLSAIEKTREAFIISISRGCILIIPIVILLSLIFGMTGVWLAFVLTEFLVALQLIHFN